MHWIGAQSVSACFWIPGTNHKHVKKLSERSKEMKEQKKNKGNFLVAVSPQNSQNSKFGLLMCYGSINFV